MNKIEKNNLIDNLTVKVNGSAHIYLTDISGLNAKDTSDIRRNCFEQNVELVVVKNTLFKRALEKADRDLSGLNETLKGSTSVMFSEIGNTPAKLIKDFRKKNDKPLLKAAYVEEDVYVGDDQLDLLVAIKSKEELIADVIGLLQSPVKNVMSSLRYGQNTLTGLLETLSKK